jgi:ribosomal protein S12 methylthiotransferase
LGRSYRDAPEIDGMVIVDEEIAPGTMADVLITGALTYDLSGVLVGQERKKRKTPSP